MAAFASYKKYGGEKFKTVYCEYYSKTKKQRQHMPVGYRHINCVNKLKGHTALHKETRLSKRHM